MTTSTNYTSLSYIEEVVAGTIPSNPAFQILPTTGGSLTSEITTAVSEVVRDDRQKDDLVIVDADISGEINYELSYTPYKPLIESLMQNSGSRAVAVTNLTADGANSTIAAAGLEASILIGDVIVLASVADPTIDGSYVCTLSGTNLITVYPPLPVAANATDVSASASSIVVNGAAVPKSYSFMKKAFNGGIPYYWYYAGCQIGSLSFDFSTGSILNGTLGVIGLSEKATVTAEAGQTEVGALEYAIMNSVSSIATINIEGVSLGRCSFSSFSMTVENNINAAKSIGILGACSLASFSLDVTADTEVYFENLDLYNKFLNSQAFSVTLILVDGLGNTIGISLPQCKFESLNTPVDAKDAFLMQVGSIQALRDPDLNHMIKFSFVDAV